MQVTQLFSGGRKRMAVVSLTLLLLVVFIIPVAAVQFGELDGDAHPHVGLLVFDVGGSPAWRCSGTLLSPTVMLTAGHCTFGTSGGRVWFDSDVSAGRPGNGYPFSGGTGIEFAEIYTHPDYIDEAFYLYDVGVVILSEPVYLGSYGTLADVGLLDRLSVRRGQQDQSFTVVGYGLQSVVPTLQADLVRYQGTVQLIDVRGTAGIPAGTSASFTNNPGRGNGSGGTCFGDSGGPIFYGESNVIAAVTSYGLNANCAGTGGGYRVDTIDDQAFINQFLP
jgi:secreted trypsin-like serine protease